MKLAVFSDVHGNLEAFQAVLADMDDQGCDAAVCLGDTIGYGPNPEACVDLLRQRGIPSAMGNHEFAALRVERKKRLNFQAREALNTTLDLISPATLEYLSDLPRFLVMHGCRFVHGAPPDRVNRYLYELDANGFLWSFQRFDQDICFCGHTHELGLVAWNGREEPRLRPLDSDDLVLDPAARHIVNAGSVGQPRDGDHRAKYCTWEPETRRLRVRRLDYDYEVTAAKIRAAGLHERYAQRLYPGGV